MKAHFSALLLSSIAVSVAAVALPEAMSAHSTIAVRVGQLDHSLLPLGDRRLIFIGGIHGCKKELVELLEEAEYNEEQDHIIAVGDIVNKGPDTLGVVDHLMSKNASSVRGNHEERIIPMAESRNIKRNTTILMLDRKPSPRH